MFSVNLFFILPLFSKVQQFFDLLQNIRFKNAVIGTSLFCIYPPKDFFISYTGADKKWAEWIAWQLEEVKFSTVIQAWDFRPGQNFVLEMDKATKDTHRTIAVLSQSWLNALYPQPEWAAAFTQDPTGEKLKLILIRIDNCKPEGLLSPIIHIDLVGLNEADATNALPEGIKEERIKPETKPSFPTTTQQP